MKLLSDYSVAVYSAQECKLYNSSKVACLADFSAFINAPRPDSQQLYAIHQRLKIGQELNGSRIIILVPDAWLSVSQHRVDHLIPVSLRPLAALSYAVEATFSLPENLLFSYQYEPLSAQQSLLSVYACSCEWAEQLVLPFLSIPKTYLLMTISQWQAMSSRKRSWSSCSFCSLSLYQPEKAKRVKARQLFWCLVVLSLVLNSTASVYFLSLDQNTTYMRIARQTIQNTQSAWSSTHSANAFSASALDLIQALPRSARLEYFESRAQRAFLQMTLPARDLELLLVTWRQHKPDWRWEVKQRPHHPTSPITQKEVVDVSIKVFKSE